QKELKVNKAVTQQKASKFQQKTPASPVADLLVDIKTRTQRLTSEFERGASERLQELVGQPTGSLARELESMVMGLSDLAQEKKAAAIGTRVPPEFEDQV